MELIGSFHKSPPLVLTLSQINLLATDFFFKFWHTLYLKCE